MSNCLENTAVVGCYDNGGVKTPVVIHYIYDNILEPAVLITDTAGVPVAGADATNTTPGVCSMPTLEVQVLGGNFSEASISADYDPNGFGPAWVSPANLQSFTVIVRKAGSVPGTTNRIRVDTPFGNYFLIQGDVRTWSVAQHADANEFLSSGFVVEAEGISAFDVIWTVEV